MIYPQFDIECNNAPSTGVYAFLSVTERAIIWCVFNLPESVQYSSFLHNALVMFHRCCCALSPAENSLIAQRQNTVAQILQRLGSNIETTELPQSSIERKQLFSELTHSPLYTTLLMIHASIEDDDYKKAWTLMTARLYLNAPTNLYQSLLILDQARTSSTTDILSTLGLTALYEDTNSELAAKLCDTVDNKATQKLAKVLVQKNRPKCQPINSKGETLVASCLETDDEIICELVVVDEDEVIHGHLLEREEKPGLTQKQRKSLFKKQKYGKANAVARNNQALAFSQQSITPLQFGQFAKWLTFELFEIRTSALPAETLGFWIIFYLEVFLQKPYANFEDTLVFNDNSSARLNSNTTTGEFYINHIGIHYQLTNHNTCVMHIVLEKELVKSKKLSSKDDPQFYDPSNCAPPLKVKMPAPFQTLFNLRLRSNKNTRKPTNTTLKKLLKIDDTKYRDWFAANLSEYKKLTPRHMTRTIVRSAFSHFIKGWEPESVISTLKSQGTTPNHYLNGGIEHSESIIESCWLAFLEAADIVLPTYATSEAQFASLFDTKDELRSFGCDFVLNKDVLEGIALFFTNKFSEYLKFDLPTIKANSVELSELQAAYIGFRAALIAPLRNVINPFPEFEHISLEDNIMSVQDKDAHQNNERRLVFLDKPLCENWTLLNQWCKHCLSPANIAIAYLDDKQNWQALQRDSLIELLAKHGINIDFSTFRKTHYSFYVQAFDRESNQITQQHLSQQMNHFDYGQFTLRRLSSTTIKAISENQTSYLNLITPIFEHSDQAFSALLKKILKNTGAL